MGTNLNCKCIVRETKCEIGNETTPKKDITNTNEIVNEVLIMYLRKQSFHSKAMVKCNECNSTN